MSLRARLIILCGAAVAIAICIAAVGSYVVVRGELRGQIDDTLTANADAIQSVAGPGGPAFARRLPDRVVRRLPKQLRRRFTQRLSEAPEDGGPPRPPGAGGVLVQALSGRGKVALPPGAEPELDLTAADRDIAVNGEGRLLEDRRPDGDHLRVLTVPIRGGGAIQVARSLDGVDDVLARLRIVLALLVAGGIALAALLAWLVSRRVIAPIVDLTRAAEHVSETEDLSRRIEVGRGDEVGRLARRFNTMLDTLDRSRAELSRSVSAQRQLVADASHELRTPVASLRTDIETLLRHPDLRASERAHTLAAAEARVEELGALIADVIELARGEEPDGAAEEVRLDELVAASVVRMRRIAPGQAFKVRVAPCVVEARPDRLERAVNNLLDNARKHGSNGGPIEVGVCEGVLTVRDHGPGIPGPELGHIFNRFYRGAGSRSHSGSGLGLAIVRQVAHAYGGEVSADNAPGGGAVFRLRLPCDGSE